MSINIRRVGEVADGSVTEIKLANGAVSTGKLADGAVTNPKVNDNAEVVVSKLNTNGADFDDNGNLKADVVDSEEIVSSAIGESEIADDSISDIKIKNSAIVEAKIADLAISTGKLKNNVVTLAKADDDVRVSHFVGDETEVENTGTDELDVKEFTFPKKSGYSPVKLRFIGTLKTNDVLKTASLKIYFDEEAEARATYTSTSLSYEMIGSDMDISDLTAGKHKVIIKLVSDIADGVAYNDLIDALLIT